MIGEDFVFGNEEDGFGSFTLPSALWATQTNLLLQISPSLFDILNVASTHDNSTFCPFTFPEPCWKNK